MQKASINFFKNNPFAKEFLSEKDRDFESLPDISIVNLFVGANNSRKSRFLRGLLKEKNFNISSEEISEKLFMLRHEIKKITNKIDTDLSFNLVVNNRNFHGLADDAGYLKPFKNVGEKQLLGGKLINKGVLNGIIEDFLTIFSETKNFKFESYKDHVETLIILFEFFKNYLTALAYYKTLNIRITNHIAISPLSHDVTSFLENNFDPIIDILQSLLGVNAEFTDPTRVYVPLLRTAHALVEKNEREGILSRITQDIYKDTIEHHYGFIDLNLKGSKIGVVTKAENKYNVEIFTGLDFYEEIKTSRNNVREVRDNFSAFENFISENFFSGKEVDFVALDRKVSDHEHIQVHIEGEERNRNLYELGDGIQALIILLYPIFMAQKNTWLFIEEPEMNMHPGMIHLFLKTILANKEILDKNLRFFFTTHSNHLLNLSSLYLNRISIFSFQKNNQTQSKTVIKKVAGNDTGILDSLGVYNLSVFMANCSIWVEGIIDRKIIKAFLNAYMKTLKGKFLEDLNYNFFEYSGSNLSHYLFDEEAYNVEKDISKIKSFFIANRIFLLADQDNKKWKTNRHNEFKKLAKSSKNMTSEKFQYATTVVLEIENLITSTILKKFLITALKIDRNIIDKLEISDLDYSKEKLGFYLEDQIEKIRGGKKIKLSDKKSSGSLTAKYKNLISDFILTNVENDQIAWDMIKKNAAAKKLTESIYNFIAKHNEGFN